MAKKRSWEARLTGQPTELAQEFVESLSVDRRLYKYDIVGSIAHAKMLAARKLITRDELSKIKKSLLEIADEIADGKFKFNTTDEDIHMAIESALVRKIGETGQKLHTGRSRNDQVATDLRLWSRDEIEIITDRIRALQSSLVRLAEKYTDDLMPSYTHLQRAQPIVLSAYLLSFVEQFERDAVRLANTKQLLNVSPLGTGAIAGSTLPLDRNLTANELGFSGITANSMDTTSDRDFCAEFIFDCALIAAHLSKMAEDWIVYSTTEFDFIRLSDTHCTSSSMMPQKRNPDLLELVRGRTGRIYAALTGIMTVLKAQPSGYNRDLQEDKIHLFSAADCINSSLAMTAEIVSNTTFNTDKIATGMDKGFLDATALAEYLVTKGVAFRQAHRLVGALVAECEKKGRRLSDLTLDEYRRCCRGFDEDVFDVLSARKVVQRYATAGSGGPKQAKEQIRNWRKKLSLS